MDYAKEYDRMVEQSNKQQEQLEAAQAREAKLLAAMSLIADLELLRNIRSVANEALALPTDDSARHR